MKPAHSRRGTARAVLVILFSALSLWSVNALVIGFLDFSLPTGFAPGASWARHWSDLVQLYTQPLVVHGVPVGSALLGLLVWWRTASPPRALGVMGAVSLVWWQGLVVDRSWARPSCHHVQLMRYMCPTVAVRWPRHPSARVQAGLWCRRTGRRGHDATRAIGTLLARTPVTRRRNGDGR